MFLLGETPHEHEPGIQRLYTTIAPTMVTHGVDGAGDDGRRTEGRAASLTISPKGVSLREN